LAENPRGPLGGPLVDLNFELLDPSAELPDDTPTDRIRFPTRIRNVLATEGLKTAGEIREASDEMLMTLPDLGRGSVAYLRETLGRRDREGADRHT
jgi:DNA-directed RNA polymerase alpha subunit